MSKHKIDRLAEDNISSALTALHTARKVLFYEMGGLQRARRNPRMREVEWAICDAIKVALTGPALLDSQRP